MDSMRLLIPIALIGLIAAAPSGEPEDLIRRANAAFLAGDAATADSLYAAAEERTGDPGLVSFNKAAILFQKGEFYAAEVHYARTLDDSACPTARAARAWFNRGTCLLRRGGSPGAFRSAIACFDRCLDSQIADEPLKADARHNLELAKLLWAEANKKASKPETPNAPTFEERKPEPPVPQTGLDPGQTGNEITGPKDTKSTPMATPANDAKGGNDGGMKIAGDVPNPQPLLNESTPQKLSPEDTREYLRRAEERLRDERRQMLRTISGTQRTGVRDW